MKNTLFFLLLLTLLPSISYAADFKVLWWNIGFHHKQLDRNLDLNIEKIIRDNYDLIGLGETIIDNFSDETQDKIQRQYPFRSFKKYGVLEKNGIWVLSKHPFEVTMRAIDWTPLGSDDYSRRKYISKAKKKYSSIDSFYRDQAYIHLIKDGRSYDTIFYHLSNPWPRLVQNTNKYTAAWEILTGQKNPVINQISHLKQNLKDQFGESYRRKRIIMMGDSNCPRKVKGFTSACYTRLAKTLPIVLDKKRSFTYPADESTDYKVRIDHAQASDSFGASSLKVLKIQGSDHFPLSLSIHE